ncbi:cupin domain-containing protein [Candidatus Poribacteria bacterium]|nr:cupin domain-containing protein [Candidatus Poribacteria bacterium]
MNANIRTDIKGIDRFIFETGADADKLHLHISEVAAGTRAHAPHQHDGQEIFYVFSGEGEVVYGEETHQLAENQAIHVDCRVLHGIRNVGNTPLRYAVIIAR